VGREIVKKPVASKRADFSRTFSMMVLHGISSFDFGANKKGAHVRTPSKG